MLSTRFTVIMTCHSSVKLEESARAEYNFLMPFSVGAVVSPLASMMHCQANHGPVATADCRAVPFPPVFDLPPSQQYQPSRPLEPLTQGLAPPYSLSRPDGKQNRQQKGTKGQFRSRKNGFGRRRNKPSNAGLASMLKANGRRARRHFARKYTQCACCDHLKARYCLGPLSDTDDFCDAEGTDTPRTLPVDVRQNMAQLSVSEALKPGSSPPRLVDTPAYILLVKGVPAARCV